MNQGRKAILFLLMCVMVVALSTFIYNKYNVIQNQEEASLKTIDREKSTLTIDGKLYDYNYQNAKYSIALDDNSTIKGLIKNFKYCTIAAGFPIAVKQNAQGLFEILEKSPLAIHSDVNKEYDITDTIIGTGFIANGSDVGLQRSFQILQPSTSYVKTITYTVVPIVNCF